eukprot:CAMPEP_0180253738 /NCGR_PEP_ID=MMETSP0987-20121128/39774_1 /TAXON_ID=697907 /ORGANISM="non described non described, Strain CCMP2293" /LENGTH=226 /DNA_ID=CAMNT_0022222653 /DNA_START=230 /DNA_END=906 /DNA_ORIENTATION=+
MSQMYTTADLPKVLLFYAEPMADLAEKIQKHAANVQLGIITWQRQADDLCSHQGFARITIEESWKVRGSIVFFLCCLDDSDRIYDNLAVMTKITRFGPSTFKIMIPFFPSLTLQAEGGDRGLGVLGEIPISRTMTRLLSLTPRGKSGPTEVVIFDIHHLQERFYFEDDVAPRLESAMTLVTERLDKAIEIAMLNPPPPARPPSERARPSKTTTRTPPTCAHRQPQA